MTEDIYDVAVVGGGPAGLAAAVAAHDAGAAKVVVLERDTRAGGILLQCIHNGFGLHHFGEELTGPEYASRFLEQALERGIKIKTNTMVVSLDDRGYSECGAHDGMGNSEKGAYGTDGSGIDGASKVAGDSINNSEDSVHVIIAMSTDEGMMQVHSRAVVFSTGCRERTRGALMIAGSRPAGVLTAGAAQRFVNIDGYLPGRKIVILGSGDIGLIMARRLTLEGCEVKMVCEVMPRPAGLARNMTQCLENFNIPLRLSTTVVYIHGDNRVTGVTIAKVDDKRHPIGGTEEYVECDTLLLSVGLIPENEVCKASGVELDGRTKGPLVNQRMQTNVKGVFACGNAVHVHDLVDYVTEESLLAGKMAAEYAASCVDGAHEPFVSIPITAGAGVNAIVPQRLDVVLDVAREEGGEWRHAAEDGKTARIMFRATNIFHNVVIAARIGDKTLAQKRAMVVRPGEMQTLEVPLAAVSSLAGGSGGEAQDGEAHGREAHSGEAQDGETHGGEAQDTVTISIEERGDK